MGWRLGIVSSMSTMNLSSILDVCTSVPAGTVSSSPPWIARIARTFRGARGSSAVRAASENMITTWPSSWVTVKESPGAFSTTRP
jgi:hypothetical protein